MKKLILSFALALALFVTGRSTVHNISISGFAFNPANLTVIQGDTVRWTNFDNTGHTTTSDSGVWSSPLLGQGESYQRQFSVVGGFPYHCTPHPSMKGRIQVDQSVDVENQGGPTLPRGFELSQNHPNPFNASTLISYALPYSGEVTLAIYNILGQPVRVYREGWQTAGGHSIVWDGKNESGDLAGSGIYFYRLQAGELALVRKMMFVK